MPELEASDDFDFEPDDRVLVRVRENGTSGNILAKFEADVDRFESTTPTGSDVVRLDPPWRSTSGVRLWPYEAEFEVLDE
jgi:hypothetical protein